MAIRFFLGINIWKEAHHQEHFWATEPGSSNQAQDPRTTPRESLPNGLQPQTTPRKTCREENFKPCKTESRQLPPFASQKRLREKLPWLSSRTGAGLLFAPDFILTPQKYNVGTAGANPVCIPGASGGTSATVPSAEQRGTPSGTQGGPGGEPALHSCQAADPKLKGQGLRALISYRSSPRLELQGQAKRRPGVRDSDSKQKRASGAQSP